MTLKRDEELVVAKAMGLRDDLIPTVAFVVESRPQVFLKRGGGRGSPGRVSESRPGLSR